MEEEKKKTTFLFVFLTYLHVVLLKFDRESSLDVELNSASNEYPLDILFMDPATPKTRNTWKNVGMMHYFLGMEVWKNTDGIFLGQGKYVVEILKSFGMMDWKAITTPMASNLNLLSDASS